MSVVCLILFLYKSGQCFYKFSLHETVTKLDVVSPQNHPEHPIPKICINLGINPSALESLNITSDEYRNGEWRNEQNKFENEEDVYNRVANEYSDVIDKIILRVNDGEGGGYTDNTIYENDTDIEMWKMEQYCEYYYELKCICIFVEPDFSKKGIQLIRIILKKTKNNFKGLYVISPGHFYTRQMKRNGLTAEEGFRNIWSIYSFLSTIALHPGC